MFTPALILLPEDVVFLDELDDVLVEVKFGESELLDLVVVTPVLFLQTDADGATAEDEKVISAHYRDDVSLPFHEINLFRSSK